MILRTNDLQLSKLSICTHEPAPNCLPVGVVHLCMLSCELVHLKEYLCWSRGLTGCYGSNIH